MSPLFPFQAANYLDIKGLLDVTCKTVANMIKGKTPEEIRKTFNIKNDFTEEEEAQVDSSSCIVSYEPCQSHLITIDWSASGHSWTRALCVSGNSTSSLSCSQVRKENQWCEEK